MIFKNTRKGFTLIELLVVISIIGLLSSVVLASVNTARSRGKIAAGQKFDTYNYRAFGADGAYWNMDAIVSGSYLSESTGNNLPLTLVPGYVPMPSVVPNGIQNNAVYFSGNAAYLNLTVPSSNPLYTINARGGTLSMWIRPSTQSQNSILTGHQGSNDRLYIQYANGTLSVTRGDPAVTLTLANGVPANEWVNVALSWTGGTSLTGPATLRGYLNGAAISPQPQYSPGVSPNNFTGLSIGSQNGIGWTAFYGSIDEVHIYPNVLADSEIRDRYLAEAPAHGINVAKK